MADDADRRAARVRAGAALFNEGAFAAAAAAWDPERDADPSDTTRTTAARTAPNAVRIAESAPEAESVAVVDGEEPTPDTLRPAGVAAAAIAIARVEPIETAPIRRAAAAARDGEEQYRALLHDFVTRPAARSLLTDRLDRLTDRRDAVTQAVDGLFEER